MPLEGLPFPTRPALPPPARRRRRWPWLLVGVLVLVGLALLGWNALTGPTGVRAIVTIPKGASARRVAQILEEKGLVRSKTAFLLLVRASGATARLKSGTFRLEGRGTPAVIRQLETARPVTVRLTFPEGWRARDYARRLSARGFDGEAFLKLAMHPPKDLKPPYDEGPTLEGYLFPDTYVFPVDATAKELIRVMLERFDREITPERTRVLSVLGLSVHAWVTLASLVQAEAGTKEEMPWIAGVFLNRLEIGMPLQSDPTVAYALDKDLPELDRYRGDFAADSPYNTYKHAGLPPGPINNPGAAALDAVLHARRLSPAGKPYLYFFHAKGQLYLNETFKGHLRDLNRYRYAR